MGGIFGLVGRPRKGWEAALQRIRRHGETIARGATGDILLACIGDEDTNFFAEALTVVAVAGACFGPSGKLNAEEIARLYRDHGTLEVCGFNGHFAIAIADGARRQLLLYRDCIGIAPLHVSRSGGVVAFASEYKALLETEHETALDTAAIEHFLETGWTPPLRTFFRNIRPVPAGHLCFYGVDGAHRTQRSVSWNAPASFARSTAARVSQTLNASVGRLLEDFRDNRIGLMLSGGVDSALIGGMLRNALPDSKIQSFTVGYGEDDPEICGARATAETLGFRHTELFLRPVDFDRLLPEAVWTMENLGGHDEYPCLLAAHEAARGKVDVMFSGNLSDTLFAGMQEHRLLWEQRPASGTVLSSALLKSLRSRDERLSAQLMFATGFGISARMPYADADLIELALSIPDEQKIDGRQNKIILREAAESILPPSIAKRPKGIQQLPYDSEMADWLLHGLSLITASPADSIDGWMQDHVAKAARQLKAKVDRKAVHDAWNVVALDFWKKIFVHRDSRRWAA